jgi:hypothetical protein
MFSRIHKRLTYTNVAMTLALVFAMSGGAYAASKYLITSTKQISPKVLKSLKGANGKSGAAGPAGAQGPQGPAGAAGAKGETGAAGGEGKAGKEGTSGKEGSPWTLGGTLPSGKTETGTWTYSLVSGEAEVAQQVPISFAIPLKQELGSTQVHYILAGGTSTTECPGGVAEPKAAAGNLCVYASELGAALEGLQVPPPERIANPSGPAAAANVGAGKAGAVLSFKLEKFKVGYGTWAVTAE